MARRAAPAPAIPMYHQEVLPDPDACRPALPVAGALGVPVGDGVGDAAGVPVAVGVGVWALAFAPTSSSARTASIRASAIAAAPSTTRSGEVSLAEFSGFARCGR